MHDDEVIQFLMAVAGYVAELHRRTRDKPSRDRKPGFDEGPIPWEAFDEGFARWMGFRGEAEQEREIRHVRNQE